MVYESSKTSSTKPREWLFLFFFFWSKVEIKDSGNLKNDVLRCIGVRDEYVEEQILFIALGHPGQELFSTPYIKDSNSNLSNLKTGKIWK